MVIPSKDQVFNPTGQRAKVLLCLLNGGLNGKSIPKVIGCKESGWIHRYILSLNKMGFIDKKYNKFLDKKGRHNSRPVLALNVNFFLEYAKKYSKGLSFTRQEIKILEGFLKDTRHLTAMNSLLHLEGSAIGAMLYEFNKKLINKELAVKNKFFRRLSLKVLVMIHNIPFLIYLNNSSMVLSKMLRKYHAGDGVIESFMEKYLCINLGGVNIRNKEGSAFLINLSQEGSPEDRYTKFKRFQMYSQKVRDEYGNKNILPKNFIKYLNDFTHISEDSELELPG
jgi:hypothetical protein